MNRKEKKNIIFLSHAVADKNIAGHLFNLLIQFVEDFKLNEQFEIFYSPVSLNELAVGGREWDEAIYNTMKQSYCCLVLVTPNSIGNKWVNYELGLANAWEVMIQPVRTFGIEISQFIFNSKQVVSLEDKDNICNVIHNMFIDNSKEHIDDWLLKENVKRRISRIWINAKRRYVYIVGSCPVEKMNDVKYQNKLADFVRLLSKRLLENDCVLASYPTVEKVGEEVAKCAISKDPSKYEIAGLYRFDKDEKLEKFATDNNISLSQWNEILSRFRNVYLDGKDFMIIIGGGFSTEHEYEIAKRKISLQIIPIPCFEGFGQHLYKRDFSNDESREFKHPCFGCQGIGNHEECPNLEKFVERIRIFKSLKE